MIVKSVLPVNWCRQNILQKLKHQNRIRVEELMENVSWAINLWQVISCKDGNEDFSFYKTVLINTKPVAIEIDQNEFKRLAKRLWSGEVPKIKASGN